MIILMLLMLLGFVVVVFGLIGVVIGLVKKQRGLWIASIAVPVIYWVLLFLLIEMDRRFIEEETRKNGGVTPDWVW